MALSPILPVFSGESLTSYMSRVAMFHGGTGVYAFLDVIELSRAAVMLPKQGEFQRILEITGHSEEQLKRMTFRPLGSRMRQIVNERVHAEFANFEKVSFCPACLLEDGDVDGPSRGMRLGMLAWQIEHVRRCPDHDIILTRRPAQHYAERFQLMSDVAPDDRQLEDLVRQAEPCASSRLQDYILARLDGQPGPDWLDGQPIDLAARACEMLGILLTQGTHVSLSAVSDAAWREAGDAGFEFAVRGEGGIREALQIGLAEFASRKLKGGPQHALGRLYQWLQFKKNDKPYGPIRDVVRNFVLDHFHIPPNTELMGEAVLHPRVHSIQSLAAKTNCHPKTVARAVAQAGLITNGLDHPSALQVVNAEAGEVLMARVNASLPVLRLPGYLNCNRVQAEQLVRSGIIPRLVADTKGATGVLRHVAIADADRFMDRLLAAAKQVKTPSPNVVDLVAAAELSRWPVLDIVQGILAGRFVSLQVVDPSLKFKGLLIDPMDVRQAMTEEHAQGRVELRQAIEMLEMSATGVNALLKLNGPQGRPFLSSHHVENSKGAKLRVFDVAEIDAFKRDHVSLKEIAFEGGVSPKSMRMRLDRAGVAPLTVGRELGRVYFRKVDLATKAA
jgi:hypothetical protein